MLRATEGKVNAGPARRLAEAETNEKRNGQESDDQQPERLWLRSNHRRRRWIVGVARPTTEEGDREGEAPAGQSCSGRRRGVHCEHERSNRSIYPQRYNGQRFRRDIDARGQNGSPGQCHQWFCRGNGLYGNFRYPVAATGAHRVFAVGQNSFADTQRQFLGRPVNAISQSIGHINLFFLRYTNDPRRLRAKIGVMIGDQGIRSQHRPQFLATEHPIRYHGIGIKRAHRDGSNGRSTLSHLEKLLK